MILSWGLSWFWRNYLRRKIKALSSQSQFSEGISARKFVLHSNWFCSNNYHGHDHDHPCYHHDHDHHYHHQTVPVSWLCSRWSSRSSVSPEGKWKCEYDTDDYDNDNNHDIMISSILIIIRISWREVDEYHYHHCIHPCCKNHFSWKLSSWSGSSSGHGPPARAKSGEMMIIFVIMIMIIFIIIMIIIIMIHHNHDDHNRPPASVRGPRVERREELRKRDSTFFRPMNAWAVSMIMMINIMITMTVVGWQCF